MVGQKLAHYRVLEKLAEGGMGAVYRTRDEKLDRDVALKVLPEGVLEDETARVRFRKEALALSHLNHPNICTIYEVGESGGRSYIAMELVEGVPLSRKIPSDGLPPETVVLYGAQIAAALAHAHERGVIHRDLKSSNVIITPDGRAKVLDFGLARRVKGLAVDEPTRSMDSASQDGAIAGTLPYMAPEVFRGEPCDARSDLWSLGVLLYEMAAGRLPFRGRTGFEISGAIQKDPPSPLPGQTPSGLQAIIQQCLAKEPGRRYQHAGEVRAALEAVRHGSFTSPAKVGRSSRLALAALGIPLTAVLGWVLWRAPWWSGAPAPDAAPRVQALVVLPLANLSGDAAQDYFADGVTEALIADLGKIESLRVISRTTAMRYKGSRKPLPEIARELKVEAVVDGSVLRSGDRVRVTAQLIDAGADRQIWSETYDRKLHDILELQREVARAIAGEIRAQLPQEETARGPRLPRVNPEAYDYHLRGLFHVRRENDADNATAISLFEQAVGADPSFAASYAELARACVLRFFLFAPGDRQWEEKAFVAVEKALALDPMLAEAYRARARLLWTPAHGFQHERAVQQYRRALELKPNLEEAGHELGLIYSHIGLFEESRRELEREVAINPISAARVRLAQVLLYSGKNEEALAALRQLPGDVSPAIVGYHTVWALIQLDRRAEASEKLAELLRANRADEGGLLASLEATLRAAAGDRSGAEQRIRQAVERGKGYGHFHHTAFGIATAYARMSQPVPAVRWLADAAQDGFPCYPLFAKDPGLDAIRSDPDFVALTKKLEQQWLGYKTRLGGTPSR